MQIQWQREESPFAISAIEPARLRVGSHWHERSFWVSPSQLGVWAPSQWADLAIDDLDVLLAQQPEVILIGTGTRGQLLAPALQVHVMRRGCGIECMSNAAAARTYNVLLGEGRAVLAAFLIDAPAAKAG